MSIGIVHLCRGRWGHADEAEVDDMLAQGKPHCYRFRVPPNQTVTITDTIRGKVSWNTDTLGDFVVMRSNGLPVYNFCVAVDDALMKISHVIRAEEHLPNTLRQVRHHFVMSLYAHAPQPHFVAAAHFTPQPYRIHVFVMDVGNCMLSVSYSTATRENAQQACLLMPV